MTSTADLILHPLRLRLVQAVAVAGAATPSELLSALGDVAPATLYRHLQKLTEGGVLVVTDERPVRGTVERRYALQTAQAQLGPDDIAGATVDDHTRWFLTFALSLLDKLQRNLERDDVDFVKDGIGYHALPVHLREDEVPRFVNDLNQALLPWLTRAPPEGARARTFATVFMPDPDAPTS